MSTLIVRHQLPHVRSRWKQGKALNLCHHVLQKLPTSWLKTATEQTSRRSLVLLRRHPGSNTGRSPCLRHFLCEPLHLFTWERAISVTHLSIFTITKAGCISTMKYCFRNIYKTWDEIVKDNVSCPPAMTSQQIHLLLCGCQQCRDIPAMYSNLCQFIRSQSKMIQGIWKVTTTGLSATSQISDDIFCRFEREDQSSAPALKITSA